MMFGSEKIEKTLNLSTVLLETLLHHKLRVATAESCTGGLLAALITEPPGSSRIFLGGVVAYANAIKVDVLGIKAELIERLGAVSEEVACAMAESACRLHKADIGVGITGIAGPDGGSSEKPVGMVWLAISLRGKTKARNLGLSGDRSSIRLASAEAALRGIVSLVHTGDW